MESLKYRLHGKPAEFILKMNKTNYKYTIYGM